MERNNGTLKLCSECNEYKDETEFGKNSRERDGLSYDCSACASSKEKMRRARRKAIKMGTLERYCSHGGCDTKLSRYNKAEVCGLHQRVQDGRLPAELLENLRGW